MSNFNIIFGQRIETGKIFDITGGEIETGSVPRTRDISVAECAVDEVGSVVGALVADGKHLPVLLGHQTRKFVGQRKFFLEVTDFEESHDHPL